MKIKGGKVALRGEINVPGDKSISHRAVMIGSIAEGKTVINNFLLGEDCLSTVRCFKAMGVNIDIVEDKVIVEGVGLKGLKKPNKILDVGNSGTTIRLMSGILAAQKFSTTITGDSSIQRRPMDRIIDPLRLMGANIVGVKDKYPPLKIEPTDMLKGISYTQPIASAQVKSCIIIAGLYAKGTTKIIQPSVSRDHTERMLKFFGADIEVKDNEIHVKTEDYLAGKDVFVPGDISSAAFMIIGGLILKGSKLIIRNVGLNRTRTGIIDIIRNMGGKIELINVKSINYEPVGDILVEYSQLRGTEIKGDIIPRLIDEIPIIAVAASVAEGTTVIRDAEELKVKESNRIQVVVEQLKRMNVDIEETRDGMIIRGPNKILPAKLESYGDHRIAMALSIAALYADGVSDLTGVESIDISFPNFFSILESIKVQKRTLC